MGKDDMYSGAKVALIQLAVGASKPENLARAARKIKEAANQGAKIITLPEWFMCPFGPEHFVNYAETFHGPSFEALSSAAKENKVFIIGGTFPEEEDGKLYNTCAVFNDQGELITKFRKMHMFDINVPGRMVFKESDTLSPGNEVITFDTPYCKVGIGVCYDMRFSELSRVMRQRGCQFLVFPGAFNMTTGPAHWELLIRSRALDNQCYVAAVSPARDETASYVVWGGTTLANPWGEVVAKAGSSEEIVYGDVDVNYVNEVRQQIPVSVQKRSDVYETVDKTAAI